MREVVPAEPHAKHPETLDKVIRVIAQRAEMPAHGPVGQYRLQRPGPVDEQKRTAVCVREEAEADTLDGKSRQRPVQVAGNTLQTDQRGTLQCGKRRSAVSYDQRLGCQALTSSFVLRPSHGPHDGDI